MIARRWVEAMEGSACEPRAWSKTEKLMCVARALAGQRLKKEIQIRAAIEEFGGLPETLAWEGSQEWTLDLAAADPSGFGFELFCEGARAGRPLGDFLRMGLEDSAKGKRWEKPSGREKGERGPVMACLAHDNARALGRLLSLPEHVEALARGEPAAGSPWPKEEWTVGEEAALRGKAFQKEREEKRQHAELSLLWQALWHGAWSCAGLLLELPAFGAALSQEGLGRAFGLPAATDGAAFWIHQEGAWEAWATPERWRERDDGSWEKKRELWLSVGLRMWEASRDREPQMGSRRKSPAELAFVAMWMAGRPEKARDAGLAFEAAGCAVDWAGLGARLAGDPASEMKAWCEARSQRRELEGEARGAASRGQPLSL